MKIQFHDLSSGELVPYPVLLLSGWVEPRPPTGRGDIFLEHKKRCGCIHNLRASNETLHTGVAQCHANGSFKALIRLCPGENELCVQCAGSREILILKYQRPEIVNYSWKLLYILCEESDGTFQAPAHIPNSIESARNRLKLGAELIQCLFGESVRCQGLVPRKSIHFALDEDQRPQVQVVRTELPLAEARAMSGYELWQYHAKRILANAGDDEVASTKYLAIMADTRYKNPFSTAPSSYDKVLSLTRVHAAYGGGGLALFGSGCLYTWPDQLDRVQESLSSITKIDAMNFMDDSAYRQTFGGCFASTLGSVIHEMGHCLDLVHSEEGIMARGFDDLDIALTSTNPKIAAACPKQRPDLLHCSQKQQDYTQQTGSAGALSRCTSVSPKGRDLLDHFRKRQADHRIRSRFGRAIWERSQAVLLYYHKWLNPDSSPGKRPSLEVQGDLILSKKLFVLVEVHDKSHMSLGAYILEDEPEEQAFSDLHHHEEHFSMAFSLDRVRKDYPQAKEVLALNQLGDIMKLQVV